MNQNEIFVLLLLFGIIIPLTRIIINILGDLIIYASRVFLELFKEFF